MNGAKSDGQIYIHAHINTENIKTVIPQTTSNDEFLGGNSQITEKNICKFSFCWKISEGLYLQFSLKY